MLLCKGQKDEIVMTKVISINSFWTAQYTAQHHHARTKSVSLARQKHQGMLVVEVDGDKCQLVLKLTFILSVK